ncbi:SAM-dependent methyltransferase [Streptomyces sp. S07_1.15]|uniref:SAM-dependent methyltransferase n=1 Tax=Streptomyces sp. S07_1.15 TaxID=2873925 RepID=UPI001D143F3E|nr:SAM-dependent methyltransferase [Streptomyces sp. S07_1.15]MCC3649921.1 SAM-dependent methyltransferase [Streptomyces sp. S07_1.15]
MSDDMSWTQRNPEYVPPEIDTTRPSIARVYDAILGGKDNYPVDRAVAEELNEAFPDGGAGARLNRAMHGRVVRHLAGMGVDQFLDLGSGLPTAPNTHEVAQSVNPAAKVVYVDNDPIVHAHGRALLADDHRTVVVDADVREPDKVLTHPEVTAALDLERPLGLILHAVIHHIVDAYDPRGVVETYKKAIAPGSYMSLTHFTSSTAAARGLQSVLMKALGTGQLRSLVEIAGFFGGLDLVEPGLVYLPYWRPDGPVTAPLDIAGLLTCGGVGRKPTD